MLASFVCKWQKERLPVIAGFFLMTEFPLLAKTQSKHLKQRFFKATSPGLKLALMFYLRHTLCPLGLSNISPRVFRKSLAFRIVRFFLNALWAEVVVNLPKTQCPLRW